MFIKELGLQLKSYESIQVIDRGVKFNGASVLDNGQVSVNVDMTATVKVVSTSGAEYTFDRVIDVSSMPLAYEDSVKCFRKGKVEPIVYLNYLRKHADSAIQDSKVAKAIHNLKALLDMKKVEKVIGNPEIEVTTPDALVIAMVLSEDIEDMLSEFCESDEDLEVEDEEISTEDEETEIIGDTVEVENTGDSNDEIESPTPSIL